MLLSGRWYEVLLELKKGLGLDPKMAGMAQKDSDLANIRSAESFKKIVGGAGANTDRK